MRLHLLGLPTAGTDCPFAAMQSRFARMVEARGHDVVRYDEPTDGHGYRVFDQWNPALPPWPDANARAIATLAGQLEPGDAIATIAPWSHQPVIDAYPQHLAVEYAVGYPWLHPRSHRAFASNAWRHYLYGKNDLDGNSFDATIPHAVDPDDYDLGDDRGYLLYLGRMTAKKGLETVGRLAGHHRVITAGWGDERAPGAEHRGVVTETEKRSLLAHATAVLMPTLYLEPFGTVAVEALMSSIPVISTDFGSFPELVENDVTGWRCNTLAEFHTAARRAPKLRGPAIRKHAEECYSLDAVGELYDRWLRRLELLHGDGWYTE